jgi:septal ring factor EnvC (AmiA/AmiB activator)
MKPLVFAVVIVLGLTGCDNPQATVDSLRADIASYRAAPNDTTEQKIAAAFAKLDEQITAVEKSGNAQRAAALRKAADSLRGDFAAAKIARSVQDAKNAIQGFGEALKETAKDVGEAIRGQTNEN